MAGRLQAGAHAQPGAAASTARQRDTGAFGVGRLRAVTAGVEHAFPAAPGLRCCRRPRHSAAPELASRAQLRPPLPLVKLFSLTLPRVPHLRDDSHSLPVGPSGCHVWCGWVTPRSLAGFSDTPMNPSSSRLLARGAVTHESPPEPSCSAVKGTVRRIHCSCKLQPTALRHP